MRASRLPVLLAVALVASPVAAQEPPSRRIDLGASAGYAAPVGEAERGSRVSDTAFGSVPFGVDASYRMTPSVGVAAHARYAVTIPTLCQSASDCEASLGSDTALTLSARVYLPRIGRVVPLADVGFGYEWLWTRLVDAGAVSTRSYGGPVLLALRVAAPILLGERWTLGPVLDASLGTFTSYALGTNAASPAGDVAARAVHAWLSAAVRLGFSI
jgi:hypothetical protein